MTDNRPLILLDVDGVVNVSASSAVRSHRCFHDGWRQPKVQVSGYPYRVFHNPAIGPLIRGLAQETGAELAWATMWGNWANISISPLLGLPQDLPVSPAAGGLPRKASAVVPWTAGRPFVLFEDDQAEIWTYSALTMHQPCLLVHVNEYEGLTEANIGLARSWLLERPWENNREETADAAGD